MLGLHAEARARAIHVAALAHHRPIQLVRGVELDAGLGRRDVHRAAGLRIDDAGGRRKAAAAPRQHPVVIVAATQRELRMVDVDALADGRLMPEIERGPLDGRELPRRNLVRVDRRIAIRVERQTMAENIAADPSPARLK